MAWRDEAIEIVLRYEFCKFYEVLSDVEKKKGKDVRKRRSELTLLSDDDLFEESRYASRQIGYDEGSRDESFANW